jgi:hypothetical protein
LAGSGVPLISHCPIDRPRVRSRLQQYGSNNKIEVRRTENQAERNDPSETVNTALFICSTRIEAKHTRSATCHCAKTVPQIRPNRNRAVFQLLFVSEFFGFFAGRTAAKNIFQHLVAAFPIEYS